MHPLADIAHVLKLPRRQVGTLIDRYRVTHGHGFRLSRYAPDDTADKLVTRAQTDTLLAAGVDRLAELQEQLYAHGRWSVLCVFQAMDAAGKDGTIKHVLSGVNPQGVHVTSFKAPSAEELAHDFLWRCVRALPPRGLIGIFNRSHYEEVLTVRIHPELLANQRLPREVVSKRIWRERLEAIAEFERMLARQGTLILKFFLHVSKAEQRSRLLDRLEDPGKFWKFSAADLAERGFWSQYHAAYQEAIAATAAPHAPWFVVPADHKWFAHLVVSAVLIEALEGVDLALPKMTAERKRALAEAKAQLSRHR
jgi:PPK2 family polyphosphate:nucleotide phosphotransferase